MIFSNNTIYKKFVVHCLKCGKEFSFVADEEEINRIEYPLWYCSSECGSGSAISRFGLKEIGSGNIELQEEIKLETV